MLKAKQCPNCNEPNKPESKFCLKCRMVLTYDAYSETLEEQKKKEDKLTVIENQMSVMQSQLQALISTLGSLTNQDEVNKTAEILYKLGILSK